MELNNLELRTIRRLIYPNGWQFLTLGRYSKRTIQAVLNGNRNNPAILKQAIKVAKMRLIAYQKTMEEI
jgi:hypothetical protein